MEVLALTDRTSCVDLYLDSRQLAEVAAANRERYAAAQPFPHIVLDGILPEAMLDRALEGFPDPAAEVWQQYETYYEEKLESQGEDRLSSDLSLLLYQFNSAPFLRFLEELTGIEGLIGDPYFTGGGLHQIVAGGKLGVHADFSRHYSLPLHRRLNALIYLNRDWKDEYGGHLELWDRDMRACQERIAPIFNRMVVFTTTDWTYHGHPDPLNTPPGVTRKSIALYYFTVDRPKGETIPGKKTTLFRARPGEQVPDDPEIRRASGVPSGKARSVETLRRLTPPILWDAVAEARRKRAHG